MLDWVVVGGGIHGVTCASFLREGGVKSDRLAIVDPLPYLLASWKKSTESVGVEQLRSTHVHHVARDPHSLIRFSRTREGKRLGKLRGKYGHPDLHLFNKHSDRAIEKLSLERSHICDRVIGLEYEEGFWRIAQKENSPLYSKNVVLALGCDPSLPGWFKGSIVKDERIQVGYEAQPLRLDNEQKMLVVGGGMSGVQLALRYAAVYPGRVTLLSQKAPVQSLFDSDPGWIGPKYQDPFRKIACYQTRRKCIGDARRPGSVPPRLLSTFRRLIREKSLFFIEGILEEAIAKTDELRAVVSASDSTNSTAHRFHRLVLATGFSGNCPQPELVQGIAHKCNFPLAACGFPIPCSPSHWGNGLHLSGALAELQVGPVARNIAGARMAGESLVKFNDLQQP